MPRRIPIPSTIHRGHLSYERDGGPRCVNIFHDFIDCYTADLPVSEYCSSCQQYLLRNNPHIVLNGVEYVLDHGDGVSFTGIYSHGVPVYESIYVWRVWEDLEYTALPHVSNALDGLAELVF